MSNYLDKPEDVIQDTKDFLKSEYGKHIISTLEEKKEGYLSGAANIESPYPERYAAKYSALKEVIELINSPVS